MKLGVKQIQYIFVAIILLFAAYIAIVPLLSYFAGLLRILTIVLIAGGLAVLYSRITVAVRKKQINLLSNHNQSNENGTNDNEATS